MLYTCDACHYTFPADTLPDRCPDCGKASVTQKITINGKTKVISSPALRPATDSEIASYDKIKKEIEEELAAEIEEQQVASAMLTRTVSFITLLLRHNLSIDEHNMALILGYSFLNTPTEYIKNFILSVLNPDDIPHGFGGVPAHAISEHYHNYRKLFSSDMQSEKNRVGEMVFGDLYRKTWAEDSYITDDERLIPDAESMSADTPALNFMKYFKDGEQVIALHTPNRKNITSIPYQKIAENPSEEYKAFLQDWYNML